MNILSIDSATKAMGVAVVTEDKLVATANLNVGKTHSQRLLPLLDDLLREGGLQLADLDAVAVTVGPGSFTGLRIGIATAKAIAFAIGKQIIPIRTLDALAYNMRGYAPVVCPILDARKNEVYYGVYDSQGQELEPVGAMAPQALAAYLAEQYGAAAKICFLGDGADLYFPLLQGVLGEKAQLAPAACRYFMAASAGFLALQQPEKAQPPEVVQAFYLRLSEAEARRKQQLEQAAAQKTEK